MTKVCVNLYKFIMVNVGVCCLFLTWGYLSYSLLLELTNGNSNNELSYVRYTELMEEYKYYKNLYYHGLYGAMTTLIVVTYVDFILRR